MNRFLAALALASVFASHAWAASDGVRPDPVLTPGAVNSDGTEPDPVVTPGAVETQSLDIICHHNTSERRHTTKAQKDSVYAAYGLRSHKSGWCSGAVGCSVDHLVPLECGGADVVENLWPEKGAGAYNQEDKNKLEGLCKKLVCQKQITPAEGQAWFTGGWKAEYIKRFGPISGDN